VTRGDSRLLAEEGTRASRGETFTVVVQPAGTRAIVRGDETVLEGLLRAGVEYSYGCKHGLCGACKARLRSGTVETGQVSEFALLEDEKEEGFVLLCCARPTSDLEIEGPDLGSGRSE
jgi:ferredoxin